MNIQVAEEDGETGHGVCTVLQGCPCPSGDSGMCVCGSVNRGKSKSEVSVLE